MALGHSAPLRAGELKWRWAVAPVLRTGELIEYWQPLLDEMLVVLTMLAMGTHYNTWGRQRSVRRPRQSYAFKGMVAHVTINVAHGNPDLTESERMLFLEIVITAARDPRWELLAICVMPDHAHILLQTHADGLALGKIVSYLKAQFAYQTNGGGRWQEKFHYRLLRDDENSKNHARYIVNNPVKAGFCADFKDWAATWWAEGTLF